MNIEQQIRLNFLEEAEEYFDKMEPILVGIASDAVDPREVDLLLRSAHSIKGGAAMMGFPALSKVAHRIEDFFKILRVRHSHSQIEAEIESLLLQGLDCLRTIGELNREGIEMGEFDLADRTEPIFTGLQSYLGELAETDEDALLAGEDTDPALLLFEEGVEEVLERFEHQLAQLNPNQIAQELAATATELVAFGNMASLEPFVELCQSVATQANSVSISESTALATEALKTWKRSHALVLRGKLDKLPCSLQEPQKPQLSETIELADIQSAFTESEAELEVEAFNLEDIQSAFDESEAESESFNLEDIQSAFTESESEPESFNLEDIQSAFDESESEAEPESFNLEDIQSAFEEVEAFDLEDIQSAFTESEAESKAEPKDTILSTPTTEKAQKMVRVPASQLQQFNSLFERLVLNRNRINLKLRQLQEFAALTSQRVAQMERSNSKLKKWYDRASLEGLLFEENSLVADASIGKKVAAVPVDNITSSNKTGFDALEMDRYTEIHPICQEQMETIVQLQEATTDIQLGLQEMTQAVSELNYTTKSMQGNVTRTQMLPFADTVKRFPRVVRDLSLQLNKQVNLKIVGENTLLDRTTIEALSDPLMHLLRNAFDHGIETPETRIAAGKDPVGTITISASSQGTHNVITFKDDGGGISVPKICDRVVKMGITPEEVKQLKDTELLDFIFDPGFSTAASVTQISGRGVGMDVVRTNLQEIGADVRVSSEAGTGTTFTMRVPFTLSILRVAIIEQKGIIFAIPANTIRELIPTASTETHSFSWGDRTIPLIAIEQVLTYNRFHRGFSLAGSPAIDRPMTLVVGDGVNATALSITRFWQEQESTVRPIDSPIPLPQGIVSSVVFGDGTVVPLLDPVALLESSGDAASSNITPDAALPNLTTILVVDDSIHVRRFLSLTLEKAGYRVEEAKDGREAVDKLTSGLRVAAVISDVEMPRLDGYGLLEEIKERSEFEDLPIVMLTSRSNKKHRKLAINLGASGYFTKPYNELQLLKTLQKLVRDPS